MDRGILLQYRDERAHVLVPVCELVYEVLVELPAVFTARLKRFESIVRKLIRQRTDITRLDDIVGVRVIVDSTSLQDDICDRLRARPEFKQSKDYRMRPRDDGYRCTHEIVSVVIGEDTYPVEIQVRTVYQHLWASLSESLGQQVKEGRGPAIYREYLLQLSDDLKTREEPGIPQGISGLRQSGDVPELRIVSFDLKQKKVAQEVDCDEDLAFALAQLAFLEERTQQTSSLESVLLCSRHRNIVRMTHVRYYPSTLIAELNDRAEVTVPDWAIRKLLLS